MKDLKLFVEEAMRTAAKQYPASTNLPACVLFLNKEGKIAKGVDVSQGMENVELKDQLADWLREMLNEYPAMILLCDAWTVDRELTDADMAIPPSKHPDRTEAFIASVSAQGMKPSLCVWKYSRDDKGERVFKDFVWSSEGAGRFAFDLSEGGARA